LTHHFSDEYIMTSEELQSLIATGLPCAHLEVTGDGRHWYATVVSAAFEGQRLIQRHQKVYATLGGRMQTDEVHALSMKTYTPAEWAVNNAE
jgi:acid stress-induced BolA-like protein IbaG/YrbA